MALTGKSISIAGGGVAGLAVARALALRGAEVTLFEQAGAIGEVGAGLQLSPNGMRVVDALGLGDAVRAAGVASRGVVLRDGRTGGRVARLDLSRVDGDFVLIHRARLIEVLEAGARDAGVRLRLGEALVPGQGPEGVRIGADGLHSPHRAALNGEGAPFFTGQVAWRALVPDAGPTRAEAEVFMAPGRHLVTYPLGRGLRNIVAVEERADWAEEGWHHAGRPEDMRAAFAGFGGPVPDWLGAVGTVGVWGLFRHPVAGRWQDGTTAIIGDAAHPTLPFLAQGANMALEDAWTLAAALDAGEHELERWEEVRKSRTSRIVEAATANARNYHLAGPARMVAWGALRLADRVAPGAALSRYRWLYDFDPTAP